MLIVPLAYWTRVERNPRNEWRGERDSCFVEHWGSLTCVEESPAFRPGWLKIRPYNATISVCPPTLSVLTNRLQPRNADATRCWGHIFSLALMPQAGEGMRGYFASLTHHLAVALFK